MNQSKNLMVLQEARCPACRGVWDLEEKDFVAAGDTVMCKFGCGPFVADAATVLCCLEDADGMLQMPLRHI